MEVQGGGFLGGYPPNRPKQNKSGSTSPKEEEFLPTWVRAILIAILQRILQLLGPVPNDIQVQAQLQAQVAINGAQASIAGNLTASQLPAAAPQRAQAQVPPALGPAAIFGPPAQNPPAAVPVGASILPGAVDAYPQAHGLQNPNLPRVSEPPSGYYAVFVGSSVGVFDDW